AAPYFMAQTIVVQEYALQEAQRRIEELERRPAGGGGFLSGLFGGGQSDNRSSTGSPYQSQRGPVPPMGGMQPGQGGMMQQGRGGGFLAGAAQTAMGVAGGLLLGNVIAGMFDGGGEANAAEPSAEPAADEGGGVFGGDEEY
ncbi:DUF2076 family protein, partial [Aquabacter sp. CN5-332]|uniref:DUF2076 domain-containing protein n=1 Tax=Aquabacter sp. CN5-332 TaxID=3156608 RepID=UPI0032B504BA